MSLRRKVLICFKNLHKARKIVFCGDTGALAAGRLKINEEFRKNKYIEDESAITELVKVGDDTAKYLRTMIVQAQLDNTTGTYKINLNSDVHLEENFPYLGGENAPKRPKRGASKDNQGCSNR